MLLRPHGSRWVRQVSGRAIAGIDLDEMPCSHLRPVVARGRARRKLKHSRAKGIEEREETIAHIIIIIIIIIISSNRIYRGPPCAPMIPNILNVRTYNLVNMSRHYKDVRDDAVNLHIANEPSEKQLLGDGCTYQSEGRKPQQQLGQPESNWAVTRLPGLAEVGEGRHYICQRAEVTMRRVDLLNGYPLMEELSVLAVTWKIEHLMRYQLVITNIYEYLGYTSWVPYVGPQDSPRSSGRSGAEQCHKITLSHDGYFWTLEFKHVLVEFVELREVVQDLVEMTLLDRRLPTLTSRRGHGVTEVLRIRSMIKRQKNTTKVFEVNQHCGHKKVKLGSPLLETELPSSSEVLAKISSSEGPSSRGLTSSSTEILSTGEGC
ncbi:hypothetical protein EYF80_007747 [Liparis tanakae]|uniref:Uncharacterized protein n=1 Tax=Liparis tanakae TaxID=230148 RepID=A0A4Z2IWA1_9TELE|nr:hypothetical protein EYF80_007747 [Liparis tanakae]